MFQAAPLAPLEMSVVAGDGVVLKGVLRYPQAPVGARYPLAVLAHQYPSTGDSYSPLVVDLLALGVATLAFDLRGHGASILRSEGGPLVIDAPYGFGLQEFGAAFMSSASRVGFARLEDDIVRVAAWGAAQNYVDPRRIALVGASVGGSGVLLAAPRVTGLCGLLTFAAAGAPVFPDGPARIRASLERVRVPCLLASSEGDPFDGAPNARAWSEGLDHVRTRIVGGAEHAMAIYYEVRDEVVPMLTQALGVERRRA